VAGAVSGTREMGDQGRWEVGSIIGPLSGESTMIVGAVEISQTIDSERQEFNVPVHVR